MIDTMSDDAELDELSRQVIAMLQNDGRISIREMAMRLGVSPATVRARYNQLRDDRTIQVVAAPNPSKLGFKFHALVAARLAPGSLEQAVAVLEKKPEVAWIGLTLDDHGVLFEVVSRDARTFGVYKEQLLTELPGFISAEVSVIWDVRKFRYTMVPIEQSEAVGVDSGDGDQPDESEAG